MATYVLVGGAFIGAWAWKRTTTELRARGHDVYPVTLTGLGERVHLAQPTIDLETHITDVVNLMRFEDLTGVILVGHSYGGAVITGVADRAGELLSHLVFLDSAPFGEGDTMLDFYPPDAREALLRQVAETGDGWRIEPPPFAEMPMSPTLDGLSDDDRALLATKSVVQPFMTYSQSTRLAGGTGTFKRALIVCNDFRELLSAEHPSLSSLTGPEWRRFDLSTGHWPMLSTPSELADVLDRIAE